MFRAKSHHKHREHLCGQVKSHRRHSAPWAGLSHMGCSPHVRFSRMSPGFDYENPPSPGATTRQAEEEETCPSVPVASLNDGQLDAEQSSGISIAANQFLMAGFARLAAVQFVRADCRSLAGRFSPCPAAHQRQRVSTAWPQVEATGFGPVRGWVIFLRP